MTTEVIAVRAPATANYTVVEDVRKQLNISVDNFFSPISFERYNFGYSFVTVSTSEEMMDALKKLTSSFVSLRERTIVFCKNGDIAERLADAIGFEADVFTGSNPAAYHHFADQKCLILIASDELGIGVNLPNVKNIIHFGLPISKHEYVQQIGRAGRANERVNSYIIYLDSSGLNVPKGLLKRDTEIHSLPNLLAGLDNDYADIYRKLSNGAVSDEELFSQLIGMYNEFSSGNRPLYYLSYPMDSLERAKKHLFLLYLSGYVNDWYFYSKSKDGDGVDVFVDICVTDTASYQVDRNKMLNRMKNRMMSKLPESTML